MMEQGDYILIFPIWIKSQCIIVIHWPHLNVFNMMEHGDYILITIIWIKAQCMIVIHCPHIDIKYDETWQLCINYHDLNKGTIYNCYSLPTLRCKIWWNMAIMH